MRVGIGFHSSKIADKARYLVDNALIIRRTYRFIEVSAGDFGGVILVLENHGFKAADLDIRLTDEDGE